MIRKCFNNIKLSDKILIFFMLILLVQIIYALFSTEPITDSKGKLDAVIRTSAASIFGYFLSSNFLSREGGSKIEPEPEQKPEVKTKLCPLPNNDMATNIQLYIAGFIGVVSLVVLIVIRNSSYFDSSNPVHSASITQLRDFFASSLGFLLGDIGKSNKN